MIKLENAIKQLQELAEEHHERANKLSCVPFCNTDWAVEAGIAAAYDNAIEILTKEECNICCIDYIPAKECKNPEVWYTCYKCEKCGRKFENGMMIDDGGTTIEEEDD